MKVMNGLVITLEEDKEDKRLCVWLFYLPIREWRCQDIDQALLHEIIFWFESVYSAAVKC